MRWAKFLLIGLTLLSLCLPSINRIHAETNGAVSLYTPSGQLISSFVPFADGLAGSVQAVDLGTDGIQEIVIGAGYGQPPMVKLFRQDGSVINQFLVFDENFLGGVNVTSCDLDHDGKTEIIVGAGFGGGPQVRVFDGYGQPTGLAFFAYEENFVGGVNVTCGDIDGDGDNEIITGAGIGGGPHVKVFNSAGKLITESFAGSNKDQTGVYVSLGDVNGDGQVHLMTAPMTYAEPQVTFFSWTHQSLRNDGSIRLSEEKTYGAPMVSLNTNATPAEEIIISSGAFTEPKLQIRDNLNRVLQTLSLPAQTTQASFALAKLDDAKTTAIISVPTATPLTLQTQGQYISVDLSEQRLTAYQDGIPVKSFLVSTGIKGHATPVGITTVTDKIPIMNYVWNYGLNDPRNYNLPNVRWNLRFRQHYYIHSAYWHNNFGHPMSHGCVNMSIPDAEWVYTWANVGTVVEVKE